MKTAHYHIADVCLRYRQVGIYNIPDADSTCTYIYVSLWDCGPFSLRQLIDIRRDDEKLHLYRCLEDETLCIKSDGKKCVAIEHGRLSSHCLKLGSQLRERYLGT